MGLCDGNDEINALVEKAAKGDEKAFESIVFKYSKLIDSEVNKYFRGSDSSLDREAMKNDMAAVLHRAIIGFNPTKGYTFGIYAKRCIYNACVDYARENKIGHIDSSIEDVFDNSGDGDVLDSLLANERFEELFSEIKNTLSNYEYRVFSLYCEGNSVALIAKMLEKNEKSITNSLSRIKEKLVKFKK